jgi:cation:H+ antiporter
MKHRPDRTPVHSRRPMLDIVLVAVGIVLLYGGGESLVTGSIALAGRLGLSPLLIGLTVVAFGTSAPELAATLAAALEGAPEVAFGNVVGSNVFNVGLILGVGAVVFPLSAGARFLRREMPFMIFTGALMFWLVADGVIGRIEGVVLLALLAGYLVVLLRKQEEPPRVAEEFAEEYGEAPAPLWSSTARVVVGIALLVLGAKVLVLGAIGLARELGISERVIGLTIVACGTSLPELASSVVAAARREGDLVLGNVVGSNIFNVLAILGTTGLVAPIRVGVGLGVWVDLGVMLLFSVVLWPFLMTRGRLERWEGAVLLAGFVGYMVFLFV